MPAETRVTQLTERIARIEEITSRLSHALPDSAVMKQAVVAARARLDDLQAELEAGARFAQKIECDLAALSGRITHRGFGEIEDLMSRLAALRASVRAQRRLMSELRGSLDYLRQHMGELRSAH